MFQIKHILISQLAIIRNRLYTEIISLIHSIPLPRKLSENIFLIILSITIELKRILTTWQRHSHYTHM